MPGNYDPVLWRVGERIRARREALGWSQDELAKHMNTDKNTIYRYESGRVEMKIRAFNQLADILGTTMDELFQESSAEDTQAMPSSVRILAEQTPGLIENLSLLDKGQVKIVSATLEAMVHSMLEQRHDT